MKRIIVLIVFSSFMIIKWIMNTNNNKKMMKEINTKIHVEDIRDGKQEVDFSYLKGINSDTVGYIMVEGIVHKITNSQKLNWFESTKNMIKLYFPEILVDSK